MFLGESNLGFPNVNEVFVVIMVTHINFVLNEIIRRHKGVVCIYGCAISDGTK